MTMPETMLVNVSDAMEVRTPHASFIYAIKVKGECCLNMCHGCAHIDRCEALYHDKGKDEDAIHGQCPVTASPQPVDDVVFDLASKFVIKLHSKVDDAYVFFSPSLLTKKREARQRMIVEGVSA